MSEVATGLALLFITLGLTHRARTGHEFPMVKLLPRLKLLIVLGGLLLTALMARSQSPPVAEPKGVLQTAESEAAAKVDGEPPAATDAAPAPPAPSTLVWWNREIVLFRSTTSSQSPEARNQDALKNIEGASDALLEADVSMEPAEIDGESAIRFVVGGDYLFALLESDLDSLAGETLENAGDEVIGRMAEVREARLAQASAPAVAQGMTLSIAAIAVFIVALFLLRVATKKAAGWVEKRILRSNRLRFRRADLRPHLATLFEQLVKLASMIIAIYMLCVCVAFVFNQFPLTAPLGEAFRLRLRDFGAGLLGTAAGAIPGLITAAFIFLLARWGARITDRVIRGMGMAHGGETALMAPDAAKATRRIAVVIIWIFGFVLAYPYLPGSGSDAFKGISVLIGLMVSLGSTGLINQVMSGFVLLYSGSIRTREYVKIGQIEGKVTEMGILAVKVITPQHEYFTIPNAVVISNPLTNFSRLKEDTGVVVTTGVTIGYDVPWRQVHKLLLGAAAETEGVTDAHEPKVIQKALSDWYAEYTLVCYVKEPEQRTAVLSELNGRIQDGFNEADVQIMSPHFRDQPQDPIVVPKDRWFPPGNPMPGT
ncbi:MAG: mechanosensitive ion channel family protein [Verrucomicrobiales bacterium]